MSRLRELLAAGRTIIADGAWGTELVKRGLGRETPEAWNLSRPDQVAAVAAGYADAGSHLVITNTFGGTSIKLAKAGLETDHDAINLAGVELSRRGVAGRALVVASLGPTGELLGFTSTLSEEQVEDAFSRQAEAMLPAGPDGFVVETLTDLAEALCALRGLKRVTGLPVVVSMSYDAGARGPATMMGVTPDRAATALTEAGADIIGANCGRLTDDDWVRVVELMASATSLPLWAKANAGIPELLEGQPVFPLTPEGFVELGCRLVSAGARIVGGCCGSSPAHIAALAAALA